MPARFLIDFQCPQCGAPATLEETDHLFSCPYCRVKSYLMSSMYRFALPHSAPEDVELIYFPYWRFKGLLFSCARTGIRHRILDVSYRAIDRPQFPASLGLRSQTLRLRFVTPEIKGRFLDCRTSPAKILEVIEERFGASRSRSAFLQSLIGQTFSLIYAPFYFTDRLHDAVLNRPVSAEDPDRSGLNDLTGETPNWSIRFVPARCPDCGWDLDGERDSLALVCGNCRSVWMPNKGRFMKLNFAHAPNGPKKAVFLPFWRVRAVTTGVTLDSYADLVRAANLPRVPQPEWDQRPFYFWSPAFKIRPDDFLRFSLNLTLTQPQGEFVPELPDPDTYPVTLPITESLDCLKLTLAGFIKPRTVYYPLLKDIRIEPRGFSLIYLPFYERGLELSNTEFRMRINRNLLEFARKL